MRGCVPARSAVLSSASMSAAEAPCGAAENTAEARAVLTISCAWACDVKRWSG